MATETQEFTVADIMQTEPVTVKPDATVAELTDLLEEEGVTGIPVVDGDGIVQGVVSVSDVSRAVARSASGRSPGSGREGRPRGDGEPADFYRFARRLPAHLPPELPQTNLGARAVSEIMTPATVSVRATAGVGDLARLLDRAGLHRALVLEDGRLVGIVSAMDVVRMVAESAGEG
ncbi:MAG: HPP family protein [Gemmatimonadota bacterium]